MANVQEVPADARWDRFSQAALAALVSLSDWPPSRARDHLLLPALRLGRALGLRTETMRAAWRTAGEVGQQQPQEGVFEELARQARAGVEALRSGAESVRREAVAALAAFGARIDQEVRRVTRLAARGSSQLAQRILESAQRAREFVAEAARAATTALPSFGVALGSGAVLGLAVVLGIIVLAARWSR